jgi:hypothetical protein
VTPTGAATWSALLAAMEDGLSADPPVLLDGLPADAGPIPAALRPRAERALRRMTEIEATLERRRAEIGRELVALTAARSARARHSAHPAGKPAAYFLDTRA